MSTSSGLPTTSSLSMSYSIWILDSIASHHMSLNSLSFISLSPISFMFIMIVDDTFLPLTGIGFVIIPHLFIPHVYHISNLTWNLVFVS